VAVVEVICCCGFAGTKAEVKKHQLKCPQARYYERMSMGVDLRIKTGNQNYYKELGKRGSDKSDRKKGMATKKRWYGESYASVIGKRGAKKKNEISKG
jgi:hypothetical protein